MTQVATYTANSARSIQLDGKWAFVGGSRLDLLDISDPTHPFNLASYPGCSDVKGVRIVSETVYIACALNGFHVARLRPENFNVQVTIGPSGGTLSNYDHSISLTFPNDAVTRTTQIMYSGYVTPLIALPTNSVSLRNFSVVGRDVASGRSVTMSLQPYTMVISYTNEQLSPRGISETNLGVAYWTGRAWQEMLPCAGCGVDTLSRRITVVTDRLGLFAALGYTSRWKVFLPLVQRD
jgi:hypothetical protein